MEFIKRWILPIIILMVIIITTKCLSDLLSYEQWVFAAISSFSIVIFYIYNFYHIEAELSKSHKYDMALIPVIYLLFLILLAGLFAFCLGAMNSFLNTGTAMSVFEYFYYCVISLTSVGYGDVLPITSADKVFAITMALVGTLHMIIFVSVLVGKVSVLKK